MIKKDADAVVKLANKINALRAIIKNVDYLLGQNDITTCSVNNRLESGSVGRSISVPSNIIHVAMRALGADAQKELDCLGEEEKSLPFYGYRIKDTKEYLSIGCIKLCYYEIKKIVKFIKSGPSKDAIFPIARGALRVYENHVIWDREIFDLDTVLELLENSRCYRHYNKLPLS